MRGRALDTHTGPVHIRTMPTGTSRTEPCGAELSERYSGRRPVAPSPVFLEPEVPRVQFADQCRAPGFCLCDECIGQDFEHEYGMYLGPNP